MGTQGTVTDELPADVRALFEGANFAHIATVLPDGGPHTVPVWVGLEGDRIAIFTQEGSRKARNIARDPRVAQVSVSISGSWSVVEIVRADGFVATDVRPLVRLNVSIVAKQGDRRETGSFGMGGIVGSEGRRSRERRRRKAKLKLVRPEADEDDFAASVQGDLEQLPTIEEHDRRRP